MSNPVNSATTLAKLVAASVGPIVTPMRNSVCRGVKLIVDITAIGAGSLTVTIRGIDPTSGKTWTILASAALVGTGTTILTVYPGLVAAANTVVNDVLPAQWDVLLTVATGPVTATIGASWLA